MEYRVNGKHYVISYSELKESHSKVCAYSDSEFLSNLAEVLHIATIICFFKETPSYVCLADDGIIHQLVHLFHLPNDTILELVEIRNLFKEQLFLA